MLKKWDDTHSYPVLRQNEKGTWLKLKKEYTNSYLIVFSLGTPILENILEKKELRL